MNEATLNNEAPESVLSGYKKMHMMKEYQRLLNLVPHGKHKNQKGRKGSFGSPRKLTRK